MHLVIIVVSSLLLVDFAFGSPYQYVRQCKNNTEPCLSISCRTTSGTFPHRHTYACCLGKLFDQRNHICGKINGVTSVRICNPCKEFQCGSGECLRAHWKCDNDKNCQDGSDEVGCGHCGKGMFRCKNNKCIDKKYVCDKVNHCGDGTDETSCQTLSGLPCIHDQYRCKNDKCVNKAYVCDRDNDCGDSSDEHGCPWSKAGKKRSIRYWTARDDVKEEKNKTEEADENEPKNAATSPIFMNN